MLSFFKKKKKNELFIEILKQILLKMPADYQYLFNQVNCGLIKGTFHQSTPVKNYTGFSYDPIKSKEFEDKKGLSFVLKGIKILNKTDNKITNIDIYVGHGLIAGYATPHASNFMGDEKTINCENFYKEYLEDFSKDQLGEIFSKSQIELINMSDVYEIELKGTVYFHVKDLEDGDFIAIDRNKKVYKITHDPFEIIEGNDKLLG